MFQGSSSNFFVPSSLYIPSLFIVPRISLIPGAGQTWSLVGILQLLFCLWASDVVSGYCAFAGLDCAGCGFANFAVSMATFGFISVISYSDRPSVQTSVHLKGTLTPARSR